MNRTEALGLVKQHVTRDSLLKHMLATEAIMKAVAKKLGEDEDLWGFVCLLHDIDFQETENNVGQHCVKCRTILESAGVDEFIIHTIQTHAVGTPCGESLDLTREKPIEFALASADSITGLIIAAALVKPEKKLSAVTPKSVKNAFKKKGFAAGSDRDKIMLCEQIPMPMQEFFEIALIAMQSISDELGL